MHKEESIECIFLQKHPFLQKFLNTWTGSKKKKAPASRFFPSNSIRREPADTTLSSAPSVHRLCLEFLEQISLCSVSSCMSITIKEPDCQMSKNLFYLHTHKALLFLFSCIFFFSSHSEYFQCYSLEFLVHPL